MLTYDVKRAFSTKWLYLSVAFMLLFAALTRADTIMEIIRDKESLEVGWTIKFIRETLTGEAMFFCLPVLCTFPFATSFIDEYKSGILRFSVTRTNRRVWLSSKVITAALAGGSMLVVGAASVCMAAAIIFGPLEISGTEQLFSTAQDLGAAAGEFGEAGGFAIVFTLLLRYFFFGALGSVTGLYVSTAVNNRYMAWLAPFMVEYLLIIFCERYVEDVIILYPIQWLDPSEGWPFNGYSTCLWMLILTVFISMAFVKSAGRRLANV